MTKRSCPWLFILALAAVLGAAAACIVLQIRGPLVADEPQFADVGYSIGFSIYPMGFSGSRWHVVLTHPTLYHSLLAVPAFFCGRTNGAFRIVGVIAYALTALIIFVTARRITRERWGPTVALALFVLNPLALQSSLLLEIDTALLPLLTALFVWYLARRDLELGGGGWVGLGLVTGIALMAKLTTPPLLLAALFLHALITWKPRRLGQVALAALVAAAAFAVYYLPYTLLLRLPLTDPFVHSWGKATALGGNLAAVLLKRSLRVFLWLGAPFLIAAAILFVERARKRFRGDASAGVIGFALLAAAVVGVFYLFVGGDGYGFVKYHAPIVPLLALALGAAFGPRLARESKLVMFILGGAALAYYLYAVRDPLWWPYQANEALEVRLMPPGQVTKALVLGGAFLLFPLPAILLITKKGGRTLAYVVLALVSSLALDAWQARADYSHRYNYGERGLADVAGALKAVPARDLVVVPVDVAYYERYRHPHEATEEYVKNARAFKTLIEKGAPKVIVVRDSYFINASYRAVLTDEATSIAWSELFTIKRYGSFTISQRKPPIAAPPEEEETPAAPKSP